MSTWKEMREKYSWLPKTSKEYRKNKYGGWYHKGSIIGDDVKIYSLAIVETNCCLGNRCYLSENCRLGNECYLSENCRLDNGCHLSENCRLENGCHILSNLKTVIRSPISINGGKYRIIEDNGGIQTGCYRASFEKIYNRSEFEWSAKGYTNTQWQFVVSTAKAIESYQKVSPLVK